MQFLTIYMREAHPIDGWWLGGGLLGLLLKMKGTKAIKDVYDPGTIEERKQVATRCSSELEYGFPTLVDEMDDPVNKAYAAMPTRIYLVGVDGKVVYAGGLGPFGFKPRELKVAIEKLLSS
jgi:type I thyroxine 5'-deiodinase